MNSSQAPENEEKNKSDNNLLSRRSLTANEENQLSIKSDKIETKQSENIVNNIK